MPTDFNLITGQAVIYNRSGGADVTVQATGSDTNWGRANALGVSAFFSGAASSVTINDDSSTSAYIKDYTVDSTRDIRVDSLTIRATHTSNFDGQTDSIFHPFDLSGRKTMEYVAFLGEFDDMPYDAFALAMHKHHGRLLKALDAERATAKRAASRSAT